MSLARSRRTDVPESPFTPTGARAVRWQMKIDADPRFYDERTPKPLSVTTDRIAALNVTTAKLADSGVTNPKIANLAVDSPKIADLAVGHAKIADLAIDTAKLANLSVTSAKVAANAIRASELASHTSDDSLRAVSQDSIKSGAVGEGKFHSSITTGAADTNFTPRKLAGSGTAIAVAHSDHTHSLTFVLLPLSVQEKALAARGAARKGKGKIGAVSRDEFESLRMLALSLAHLLFDEEEMTGEERLKHLKGNGELQKKFDAKHTHDYGKGPEPRRRLGFYLTPHPRRVRRPTGC